MERPAETEYAPFYAGYIGRVPETDVLAVLEEQLEQIRGIAAAVPAERDGYRYAPGKWSLREVFGHLGDAERVFGFRAFCFSRGETAPLPSFDENVYVESAHFGNTSLPLLTRDLLHLRESNLALFRRLDGNDWLRVGNASGRDVTVRALAFMLAGHVRHHVAILAERYGVTAG
jgi:hypothetical protein